MARNNEGGEDDIPEPSGIMIVFVTDTERIVNAVDCITLADNADGTKVGKNGVGLSLDVSAMYNAVHMCNIASRPPKIRHSSENLTKQEKQNGGSMLTHPHGPL